MTVKNDPLYIKTNANIKIPETKPNKSKIHPNSLYLNGNK